MAAPAATPTPAPDVAAATASPTPVPNASLSPEELVEFSQQPPKVQKLIASALDLTEHHLTYLYGSAEPSKGGVDCSGFIFYVLKQNGIDAVPRQANEQYVWLRKAKTFRAVLSRDEGTFELDELQPGDLLFWTGTYEVDRDPPVTHTMIYLGREKSTKGRVMIGASDGRSYRGIARNGVSVFDFKVATAAERSAANGNPGRRPDFVGYARIPGLRE